MTIKDITIKKLNERLAKEEERLIMALDNDIEPLIEETQANIRAIKEEIQSRQ